MTKDLDGTFIMVLEYAENGSLKECLEESSNLTWKRKLEMIKNIADNLKTIHNLGYIHRDLHSGNILQFSCGKLSICDLGLSQSICETNINGVVGVLPYVAPEVLREQKYTSRSDIYGFGIITYEVITEEPPYHNEAHEEHLAVKICDGLRPDFNKIKVPEISHLIIRCLDANPLKRPTANDICDILHNLVDEVTNKNSSIYKQIKEAEKVGRIDNGLLEIPDQKEKKIPSKRLKIHPKAIYTSRLLQFNNLPEPKNSDDRVIK